MSSGPLMSIGGIASGLPPDLVDQIMEAERAPLNRLVARQDALAKDREAWSTVTSKLSAVRGAVDDVRRSTSFSDLFSADSSSEAVDVSVTGRPPSGSLTFTVEQLAQAQQQASSEDDVFAGLDTLLDGRTLTLDIGGETVDVTDGLGAEATFGDLIAAINDADLGVRASALQVRPGEHRLVLEATETGVDAGFEVSGDGWDGDFVTTRDALDAELDVGGIAVTRPSNTIDDLAHGLTLDLREAGTGPVTVSADRDVGAAVANVTDLVARVNEAIETLQKLTAYDAETGNAGPLQGDRTARSIIEQLRSSLTGDMNPGGESLRFASQAGIELTRTGGIQLDESALREAFETDFEAAAALFTRGGSSEDTDVATFTTSGRATSPGAYDVEVTKAAEVAKLTGAVQLPPPDGQVARLRVSAGAVSVVVTISESTTTQQAVQKINDALAEAGMGAVTASEGEDGRVDFTESRYGSARTLEVAEATVEDPDPDNAGHWDVLASGEGVDAEVRFAGEDEVRTGAGRSIRVDDGPAEGLRFTAAGVGETTLHVRDGLGGALDKALARMEGIGGSVRRASDAMQSRIDLMQNRIDSYERRLDARRLTLERQFTAMESAMGRLLDQQNQLQGQISGLMNNNRNR